MRLEADDPASDLGKPHEFSGEIGFHLFYDIGGAMAWSPGMMYLMNFPAT